MTRFDYDAQLATIPSAVSALVLASDNPSLDPDRPILFAGIGTSLHAPKVAAHWVAHLTDGQVRAFGVDVHELGTGAFPREGGTQTARHMCHDRADALAQTAVSVPQGDRATGQVGRQPR